MVHERLEGTARKRFNDNKKRFIEDEDFYTLDQPSEIRTLGIERPQGGTPDKVLLITESGYLMLVKSFTEYRRPIFGQRLEKWIQPGR